MSRSDFWSIAATLIITGAAYFAGGRISAYVCIGFGVLIALYLLATHKKTEPAPANASAKAQATANPQLTANPVQSVVLNLSDKQEKHSVPPPKPKPQHNLQLHSCKMLQVDESLGPHGEMGGFHSSDDQSKPNAAVVCIRNIRELPTNHGLTPVVEAYELGENLETVELILLSKTSRVMEPMVFEFFDDNGELGIRLVTDTQ